MRCGVTWHMSRCISERSNLGSTYYDRYTGPRPDPSVLSSSCLSTLIVKWMSISFGKIEESGVFHNLVLYIAMPRSNN